MQMELCIMNVMQYAYTAHLQINLHGNGRVGVKCLHALASGVTQQGESRHLQPVWASHN